LDVFLAVALAFSVALGFSGIALARPSNGPQIERKLAAIDQRLKLTMEHPDIAEPQPPEVPSELLV
jgi:hypothetical protein